MKKLLYLFLFISSFTFAQTTVRMSATATGTNTYSALFNPNVAAFNSSTIYVIPFTNANSSGTITLDPDSGGPGAAVSIKGDDGNDLAVGAIKAGGTYQFKFNGTLLRMIGSSGAGSWPLTGTANFTGDVTIDNGVHNLLIGDITGPYSYWDIDGTGPVSLDNVKIDGVGDPAGSDFAYIAHRVEATENITAISVADVSGGTAGLTVVANGGNTSSATLSAIGSNASSIGAREDGQLLFRTNNVDRLTIDDDGSFDLGAGFTSGTSGQVFTSNGAGAAPTWQAPSGGGASISDVAFGSTWNGNTTDGASKNALYDKVVNLERVYNAEFYGALHDWRTVADANVTSGTATLTSATAAFTTGDTGKSIRVYGAGAAGVDLLTTITYVNATTVTLGTNASTTIATKVIEWATDDTNAIQLAINACNTGGGGEVWLPNGVYYIGGALDGTTNSQLVIPKTTSASTKTTIRIKGESVAQWANGPFAAQTMQTQGVVLKSQIAGSGTLPSVIGTDVNSYTTPIFQNLQIVTKSMNGTTHIAATMSGVIVPQCETKQVYDVIVVTESDPTESILPVAETYGMYLSIAGKTDHQSIYSNAVTSGYFYGFRIAEHDYWTRLTPMGNIHGVYIEGTVGHNVGMGSGAIENLWNVYGVSFSGGGKTVDLNINTERWPGIFATRWYDAVADIYFPTSQDVSGTVNINVEVAGGSDGIPIISGTNVGHLTIIDEKNKPSITTDDNTMYFSSAGDFQVTSTGSGNGGFTSGFKADATNSAGQSGFYATNNLGTAANNVWLGYGGSTNAVGNIMGQTRANKAFLVSNGTSNAGFMLGTMTADPLIIGTSDTPRLTIGSTGQMDAAVGANPFNITSSAQETFRVIGSNATTNSLYFQSSNTASQTAFYLDNNRGSYASYGGQLYGGATNAAGNMFGQSRADKYIIFADGASNAGMAIGTLTSDFFILGTNNTARMTLGATGSLALERTNTAGGTTGDRTINLMAGSVNFAGAATSLTVTNSLVSATSNIFVMIQTNDTTAVIKNVVPGAGSFVINMGTAPTAETRVAFWVTN